ncbi:MAG: hypothetical protein A2126_02795 [Candidatus Woykebacteria bacterium GWB1_45_5]|uniref:Uncharacterized protein n=2 Tax=Candidatus Woykeibacteriota TaxID=1817899 RepID=A0A1G1VZV3_9BACT|nr:MAG: hypothetical protein A2113_01435 [Candidatus Woykebacteria bacterium GWA1_44_8]OGY24745.1 MAG: hypothetical protein A2126_02795 [Candidatus Woykebacteria bacterium GWB1_45_5]
MIFKFLTLIIELLVVSYLLGYPVSKRRPLFIREFSSLVIVLTFFSVIAIFSSPLFYLLGVLLGTIVYFYGRVWFVLGVSITQVKSALEKALVMTRSEFNNGNNEYDVQDLLKISISNFAGFQIIRFYPYQKTRKVSLIQNVFRKFISNYYISF